MCGIAGVVGVADPLCVKRMGDAMAHRGPDDSGDFVDELGQVALAHRRLSIIDLTRSGRQPFEDLTGRYWMVYNGEVYNYRSLRVELLELGYQFLSDTDTEVVLNAFIQWGAKSLSRFRGMFAFAIYDKQEGTVFLARDRLGIKPLLYSVTPGAFVFASELKALLASGLVSRTADPQAVWDYLSLGSVPQPRTLINGVQSLPPGHWMLLSRDRRGSPQIYWDLARDSALSFGRSEELTQEEVDRRLKALLEESTKLHLIADVPVGAFLSGGIDSTAVVGLMARELTRPIETYSVGFESQFDHLSELEWARLASERLGTNHHEVVVTGAEIAHLYDELVTAIDQPSLDGTNTFFVSRAARTTVTVALSGVGGDELFAGYSHFRRIHDVASTWDRFPSLGVELISRLVPRRVWPDKQFARRGAERYSQIRLLADEGQKKRFASPALASQDVDGVSRLYGSWMKPELDSVAQTTYVETRGYLLHTLLRDLDAMSMRSSLEVRPVLLDHVLAEFVFSLPARLKLDPSVNKPLLVGCLDDLVPKEILQRKKMGFEMPLYEWLCGPLRDRALVCLNTTTARKLFAPQFLSRMQQSIAGAKSSQVRLWAYVLLIHWLELHQIEVP